MNAREILQAARYSWREEQQRDRALSLLRSLCEQWPDSAEAAEAQDLISEIEGGRNAPLKPPLKPPRMSISAKTQTRGPSDTKEVRATIVDVEIPFGTWVVLLVKVAMAAIPAGIIVFIVYFVLAGVFASILDALG